MVYGLCGFLRLAINDNVDTDSKKLVVDEEAATVVRRIFAMCAAGSGPSQIARKLREEQILCPTTYAYQKFGINHTALNKAKRYTDITELTSELLRLFIQKIVVREKSTKWSKKVMQTMEIHYNDIGCIGEDVQQGKESPRREISALANIGIHPFTSSLSVYPSSGQKSRALFPLQLNLAVLGLVGLYGVPNQN